MSENLITVKPVSSEQSESKKREWMSTMRSMLASNNPQTSKNLTRAHITNYIYELELDLGPAHAQQINQALTVVVALLGLTVAPEVLLGMVRLLEGQVTAKTFGRACDDVLKQHEYKIMPNPATFLKADVCLSRDTRLERGVAEHYLAAMPDDAKTPATKEQRMIMADRMARIYQGRKNGHA